MINFGVLYGMSAKGLADATGMSVTEAKEFIERYDMFKYDCTPILEIPVSEYRHDPMQDYEKYKIQLFRIQTSSQFDQKTLRTIPEGFLLTKRMISHHAIPSFFLCPKQYGYEYRDIRNAILKYFSMH